MPTAAPARRVVRDAAGRPLADLVVARAGTQLWVDDLRPLDPDLPRVAAEIRRQLPGAVVAVREGGLSGLLLPVAAGRGRHSHHYAWDLTRRRPDSAWLDPALPQGVRLLTPLEVDLDQLWEAHECAYPPGHPDHPAGDRDRFEEIVRGQVFGPLLDGSAVAVLAGRPVAGLLLTPETGVLSLPGPGVVDIFRDPLAAPRGIGALLLRRGLARLATAGQAEVVRLQVTEGNPARRLYERVGFLRSHATIVLQLPVEPPPLKPRGLGRLIGFMRRSR